MRLLVMLGIGLCISVVAGAQGVVHFSNTPSALGGEGAPVSDVDGTRLAGTNFVAQLYGGPSIHTLQQTGEPLTFRTGAGAGFFDSTGKNALREIPNVFPGQFAVIRILVWDAHYDSWLAAAEAGAKWTASPDLHIITGAIDLPGPPPNLIGLQPFTIRLPTTHLSATLAASSLILQWDWTPIHGELECSDSVLPTEVWDAVTDSPLTVAGTFSVLLQVSDSNRFYRVKYSD